MSTKNKIAKFFYPGVVLCILITLLIAGCASASTTTTTAPATTKTAATGGTFRVGDSNDGVAIGYPPKMNVGYGQRAVAPVVETLFRLDKEGKTVPWLATGEKSDVAAKTITISLRKGVKFHDGTDFNASAVKWNLENAKAAKIGGTERIDSIDVVDDFTVRLNLSQWDSTIIGNYFPNVIGYMISPTAAQKNGLEWAASNPVGTGPFQFTSWVKDTKIVYTKFPGYWQTNKPSVDKIEWTIISDPLVRQMSLQKNDIDGAYKLEPNTIATMEKEGFIINRIKNAGTTTLVPDSLNPKSPWANIKVRQAASYAIDREAIVKAVYFGEAAATNQFIYKGHWAYNSDIAGYPFDPAKAKQLLAEAGYASGFKTKLTYQTTPIYDQTFTAIQNMLKAVGIDAQMEPIQNAKWNQVAMAGGTWEGIMHGGPVAQTDVAGAMASRYIGGGRYYSQLAVPEDYLKAVQDAISAPDFNAKQKSTQTAMKLMVDKYCMIIPLWNAIDSAVLQKNVRASGLMETANTAMWSPEDVRFENK